MASRTTTYDHLIGKKKPLTKTVPIVLDPDLAEEYQEARQARDLVAARASVVKDDTEMAFQLLEADQKLAELRRRMEEEDAVVLFRFRGIGRARFEAMVDHHQPTAEQRAKAKTQGYSTLSWNPETFPPALVAACLVEPDLTEAQVAELWCNPDWNQAELQTLLDTSIEVNAQRRTVELGKDWSQTRSSEPRSPSA